MRKNRHRKVGDSYWVRAQKGRMLPKPRCGRRVGLVPGIRGTGWPRARL